MSKNSISGFFVKEALRTESPVTPELIERLTEERTVRLLHASMGLVTEAGELLDALKKFIFYGKDLDLVNIKEEIGDSQWYTAIALDEIGNSYEEIWAMVIKKLQARYKGNFNKEGAVNRDLSVERRIMEEISDRKLIEITETVDILPRKMHFRYGIYSRVCGIISGDYTAERSLVNCENCKSSLYFREK